MLLVPFHTGVVTLRYVLFVYSLRHLCATLTGAVAGNLSLPGVVHVRFDLHPTMR